MKMSDVLVRIVAPHFVAGVIGQRNGAVITAAPIVRYMVGWTGDQVAAYCSRKGWACERVQS